MASLLSVVFFLALALNTYYAAKRSGRWSWPQFFVIVAALVLIPVVIVHALIHLPWRQDKPAVFTLVTVGLILLVVTFLSLALNKFWPLPTKKPPS